MAFRFCPRCGGAQVTREVFGRERQVCSVCDLVLFHDPKVVVVVLVFHAGKVLLGRRNIEPAFGEWSFPGGYVERGEVLEDAARREVKEETNLDVRLTGLLGVYSRPGNPNVLINYTAEADDISDMQPQPEEVSELAFFPPDNLPPVAFESEKHIIAQWRARDGNLPSANQ